MESTMCTPRVGRWRQLAGLALLALAVAQCSLGDASAPALGGPSGFAMSLQMTASPDQLPRDGVSQSTITITARNSNNQPIVGQWLTVGVSPASAAPSETELQTDVDGTATIAVTALPPTALGNTISVLVLPVGFDAGNARAQAVSITVLGPGNTTAPTPNFTFIPAAPTLGQAVVFDAGTTTDEGVTCGAACTYQWAFGDGATATGQTATHAYSTTGTFAVTLTATDAAGVSASTTKHVTVTQGTKPTAAVTFSPTEPALLGGASVTVNFDAGGSTVEAGATITSYTWVWGDGTDSETTTTAQTSHDFTAAGTFVVRVTVTDNFGRTGTATAEVEVAP